MKKRYTLALVVVEQILEEETPGGNGAWVDSSPGAEKEWVSVDSFDTEEEASKASFDLYKKYETS